MRRLHRLEGSAVPAQPLAARGAREYRGARLEEGRLVGGEADDGRQQRGVREPPRSLEQAHGGTAGTGLQHLAKIVKRYAAAEPGERDVDPRLLLGDAS